MVRADASKLKRKMAGVEAATKRVNDTIMRSMAEDIVDDIEAELFAIDTSLQTGFEPALFVANLAATLRKDSEGFWIIDPWEAGGNEEDFEMIAGDDFSQILGEHGSKSLWHAGTGATDRYFQFIHSNVQARNDLGEARQDIWGGLTPQWFLLEFGSPEASQPDTHFIQNALDAAPVSEVRAAINRVLHEGFNE